MSKNELRSSGEPRSGGFANGASELYPTHAAGGSDGRLHHIG